MASLLVLNGPNLNLLGRREPEIYGAATLADIESELRGQCETAGVDLQFLQSNAEADLINAVQATFEPGSDVAFMLLNPAAFTHTSIALRDAILAVQLPFIEIHVSNVHAREAFRQQSYFSDIAAGLICGLGVQGYRLAAEVALATMARAGSSS